MTHLPCDGAHRLHVAVQETDFDLAHEVAALRLGTRRVGAVACFVGLVREWFDMVDESSATFVLEHYPGMTERSILNMVDDAMHRFDLHGARVIHRVGNLCVGDQIVMVAVSAPHRSAAFQGCEFLMDGLKTRAPFWKKQVSSEGAHWVQARAQDDVAMARWQSSPDPSHPPVADMNRTTRSGRS